MDKRGCFNEKCQSYKRQTKYNDHFNFCPLCAKELVYVCGHKKCYEPLLNVRKRLCDSCLVDEAEQKEKFKVAMKGIPAALGVVATGVATIVSLKKILLKSCLRSRGL